MADGGDFKSTVEELFRGMDMLVSSKSVVGDPVKIGDTVLIPLMDVSFAVGAGASAADPKKPGSGGGIGGKMSPTAVLVISNGTTKMVSVKNQEGISKLVDMVPDFVNRFTKKHESSEDAGSRSAETAQDGGGDGTKTGA